MLTNQIFITFFIFMSQNRKAPVLEESPLGV